MKNDGGRTRRCELPAKHEPEAEVREVQTEDSLEMIQRQAADSILAFGGERCPVYFADADEPADPVERDDYLTDRDKVPDPKSEGEVTGLLSLDTECDCIDCTCLLRRKTIFAG